MTYEEALSIAIKCLQKRLFGIDKRIEEDFQSEELTGEIIHYKTDERLRKAIQESRDLENAILKLEEMKEFQARIRKAKL